MCASSCVIGPVRGVDYVVDGLHDWTSAHTTLSTPSSHHNLGDEENGDDDTREWETSTLSTLESQGYLAKLMLWNRRFSSPEDTLTPT